jgi:phosphocarrier protein
MRTFNYVITDPVGIHARPAGVLVKAAQGFSSAVTLEKSGKSPADLKKLFAVMGLAVKGGDEVTVCVEGTDEDAAAEALAALFSKNL